MRHAPAAPAIPLEQISITIGVAPNSVMATHHRHVKAEIETLFGSLREDYPHTPIVVLSMLASVFDLLVVETARHQGAYIIACMPTPTASAKTIQLEPALQTRFDSALKACSRVESFAVSEDDAARVQFIATYSHLSLGFSHLHPLEIETRSAGAAIEDPVARTVGLPEPGPVFCITLEETDEAEEPKTATSQIFPERFTGDASFQADFATALKHINTYNCEGKTAAPDSAVGSVIDLQNRTDAIANVLQTTTYRYLYMLYICAIAATAAQYVLSPALKYPMIALAFVAYLIAKRKDFENRYQDYRAFSEGLRVQEVWIRGGVSEALPDEAYLKMQERDLLWIRMALRYVHLVFRARVAKGSVSDPAVKDWIDGQWNYFHDKPRIEERDLNRIKIYTRLLFYVATTVSTILFVYLYVPTAPRAVSVDLANVANNGHLPLISAPQLLALSNSVGSMQTWLDRLPIATSDFGRAISTWDVAGHHQLLIKLSTAFLTVYAAVALLLGNFASKRGFALNVKRYDRMFIVFDRAKKRLETVAYADDPLGRRIIRDIGREALIENADWLLVRRDRPLAFVNTG